MGASLGVVHHYQHAVVHNTHALANPTIQVGPVVHVDNDPLLPLGLLQQTNDLSLLRGVTAAKGGGRGVGCGG